MWAPIHFFSFLVVTGIALYLAFKAVHVRYTYIRLGKPASIPRNTKERLKAFSAEVFGQKKLLKDRKSGWMHVIVFYGFIILQFGAVDLIYKGLSGKPLPIPGYDTFSLMQEITVLLVLLAAGYAGYRRYIEKVKRLKKRMEAQHCAPVHFFADAFHSVHAGVRASRTAAWIFLVCTGLFFHFSSI